MTNDQQAPKQVKASPAAKAVYACVAIVAAGVAVYAAVEMGRTNRQCPPGQPCLYDTSEMRKSDPAMIKFREAGTIKTGLKNARGIAVGPQGIYVVGDMAVRLFGNDGSPKDRDQISLLGEGECVAVGPDGAVYVGLRDSVEVYKSRSRIEFWQSLGERAFITCIAVAGDDVFVADAGNRVILRCDRSGKVLGRIGQKDDSRNIPGLVVPSHHLDVAMAPDGLLRVNNPGRRTIEAYTVDGDLELSWGKSSTNPEGFPGCCNPTDIATFADGRIVASDKGLPRVKLYAADGTFLGLVAGPETFTEAFVKGAGEDFAGLDLAVDGERVLVLDPATGIVRIFVPKETAG